jgi:predicted transcriptional regulator
MAATTVKVDGDLRDRIAAYGEKHGLTNASVIERALEALLRQEKLARQKQAMARMTAADWQSYRDEVALFDAVAAADVSDL